MHHALRLAFDDLTSYEEMIADLRAARFDDELNTLEPSQQAAWDEKEQGLAERRDRLTIAAEAVGLGRSKMKNKPSFREIVRVAGEHVSDRTSMRRALNLSLRELNSVAHFGNWHNVPTATPVGPRDMMTFSDLYLAAGGAATLMQEAIPLFEKRAETV